MLSARVAEPVVDIRSWLKRLHPTSVSAPLFWLTTPLAGAWVVGMAVEDTLATVFPAEVAYVAAWVSAGLVAWRFGLTAAWATLTRVPEPEYRMSGWAWAPPALAMAALATWYGLPIWGWL